MKYSNRISRQKTKIDYGLNIGINVNHTEYYIKQFVNHNQLKGTKKE